MADELKLNTSRHCHICNQKGIRVQIRYDHFLFAFCPNCDVGKRTDGEAPKD